MSITVWQAFYDVLRAYGMQTMFGNPGSTEQPMLKNFPSDFNYILGLQEASVVAMAGGYSQATRKPVVVSLHTAAGTGNGMGNVMSAFMQKNPLIVIAGQQHREMLIGDPFLANREETTLPKPWVKWAYQPVHAKDVPAAVIRAIAVATMPPQGPVYLSIPLDDWDQTVSAVPVPRLVSTRIAPDPEQLAAFASQIRKASKLALVYGPEIDQSLGWAAGIELAELLGAPVYQSTNCERAIFPQTHPLFQGALPPARGPLSEKITGYDLVVVIGAEIWRYYPYVAGPVVPAGTHILQVTNDPHDAAAALVGDALLSDARLALEGFVKELRASGFSPTKSHESYVAESKLQIASPSGKSPMTALDAFTSIAKFRPKDAILVQESPSNGGDLLRAWPSVEPETYFTFASGGLGWNAPAAIGMALAQKENGSGRPIIAVIGDGSINYSVQCIYTAVRQKLKVIFLIPKNEEYAILKEFAVLEETPNVPALDLPGLDAVAAAKAYGCPAYLVNDTEHLQSQFAEALKTEGPVLIEFPIDRELRPLVAQVSSHPK